MDFNIEVRKKQLQSLDQYISSSRDKVESILDYLGWNGKKVLENQASSHCSVNPSHCMPLKSVDEHFQKCLLKTAGYQINDNFLSEPLYNSTSSIKFDNAKKVEILTRARYNNQKFKAAWNGQDTDPMTSDRLFSTFSMDERLSLYDYCVKNTEPPPTPTEFNIHIDDKKSEKLLTQEELLARERDSKRRRIKYKSVHTSNKNHREVIKEVIENQMDLYKEYLASKTESNTRLDSSNQNIDQNFCYTDTSNVSVNTIETKEKNEDTERPHSSFSRHSTHSSSSRGKRYYENENKRERRSERNGTGEKRSYKIHEKKYDYDDKYGHSPYKDKRRGYRERSKERYRHHSRDKHERYRKSERRH